MTTDNRSLDGLIREVIQDKHELSQQAVSLEEILQEVRACSDAEDADIIRWVNLLNEKKLIRKVRPNAYVPANLDSVAQKLGGGVAELIASIKMDDPETTEEEG